MDGIHTHFPGDNILGEEDVSHEEPFFIQSVRTLLPENLDPVLTCKDSITSISDNMYRVWVIDPIDGTYGFIKNQNYAVAMALLIDLKVVASIVAWPRHSPEFTGLPVQGPLIFVAALNHGAYAVDINYKKGVSLEDSNTESFITKNGYRYFPLKKKSHPINRLIHSEQSKSQELQLTKYMLNQLHIDDEMAMVSMTKGFTIACGTNKVYLRLRGRDDEHVWDIAPFEMLLRECGCYATTPDGKGLVYNKEGRVENTKNGILFTCGDEAFHQEVLHVYNEGYQLFFH